MDIAVATYSAWKAIVITSLGLSIRCADEGTNKFLIGIDANAIQWEYALDTSTDSDDLADFNSNVLALCNKQKGAPVAPFAVPNFDFKGGGVKFTAAANTSTTAYYKITSSTTVGLSIVGGNLYTNSMTVGDTVALAVVDKDGIMSPQGTIIKSYVTGWNVSPTGDQGINTPYGIYIPGGLYIAITYTNTALLNTVAVGVNFFLHQAK